MTGLTPQSSRPTGLESIIRWLLVGAIPGLVAGIVVGGGCSRIVMRIVGAMEGQFPPQETDFGFDVGVSTAGGTIFLLIAGSAAGLVGGLFYMSVRPWLGATRRWRGPLFSAVLLLAGGGIVIEAGNSDFSRFGSPTLNIFLFAALFILFGLLLAPLAEWTDTRLQSASSIRELPAFDYALFGVVYLIVAVPLALFSLLVFTGLVSDPVKFVIPALLISLFPLGYVMRPSLQPGAPHRRPRIFLAGYGILAVACLLGLVFGVQAIIDIQDCADTLSSAASGFALTEEMASALCQ